MNYADEVKEQVLNIQDMERRGSTGLAVESLVRKEVVRQLTGGDEHKHTCFYPNARQQGDNLKINFTAAFGRPVTMDYSPLEGFGYLGQVTSIRPTFDLVDDGRGETDELKNAAKSYKRRQALYDYNVESSGPYRISSEEYYESSAHLMKHYAEKAKKLDIQVDAVDLEAGTAQVRILNLDA